MHHGREVPTYAATAVAALSLPHVAVTRDAVTFAIGATIAVNEAFVAGTDRPNILMLAGGLMGLAAYLRSVEATKKS